MMKLIRYFLINRVTKNPMVAARIYQMIYHPEIAHRNEIRREKPLPTYEVTPPQTNVVAPQRTNSVLTERSEIQEALQKLRSKPNKTVADRTSIDMLQAVLANM